MPSKQFTDVRVVPDNSAVPCPGWLGAWRVEYKRNGLPKSHGFALELLARAYADKLISGDLDDDVLSARVPRPSLVGVRS